jgi:hypothetical protein
MRASRGMGDINPKKMPKTTVKRDGNEPVKLYKKGGEVWDKPRPKGLGKSKPLSPKKKSSAKAAGRPYPNLVDNMRAARGK